MSPSPRASALISICLSLSLSALASCASAPREAESGAAQPRAPAASPAAPAAWSALEKKSVELSFVTLAGFWHTDPALVSRTVSELLTRMLPDCRIVWGPALHQPAPDLPGGPAKPTDALELICREAGSGDYFVVFRGTNPFSTMEWLSQDFMVGRQQPWRGLSPGGAPASAMVSEGTASAVSLRLGLEPAPGLPGAGIPFSEALRGIASDSAGRAIHFTGHSLGGLLAPVMALWLLEDLERSGQGGLAASLDLDVRSFASPTEGNSSFAAYCGSRLPRFLRYASDLDVVPLAWDEAGIARLPALYRPAIGMQPLASSLYAIARGLGRGRDYAHAGTLVRVPSSVIPTSGGLYLLEVAYQHFMPYLSMLDPAGKETLLTEVIEPISERAAVKGLKPIELQSLFGAPL